ncbi:hypothetical protein BKA69DRAFT_1040757 [Paraphysoderma sedebokerense]|nr:hypothetical protein BKA69DRAFT_1040757 [Paraphysoderma sedebokerense]
MPHSFALSNSFRYRISIFPTYDTDNNSMSKHRHMSETTQNSIDGRQNGLVGLRNLGNTCYMNCSLQALSNMYEFFQVFLLLLFFVADIDCIFSIVDSNYAHSHPLTEFFHECQSFIPNELSGLDNPQVRLSVAYASVVRALWSGKYSVYPPIAIVTEIKRYNEMFLGYGQHDSQEFLRCLLDRLHDELSFEEYSLSPRRMSSHSPQPKQPFPSPSSSPASSTSRLSTSSSKQKSPQPKESIISDLFAGALESHLRCKNCGHSLDKQERIYDLLIQIDKGRPHSRSTSSPSDLPTHLQNESVNGYEEKEKRRTSLLANFFSSWWRDTKLEDCLNSFFSTELLQGQEQYKCERCKVNTDTEKTLRLMKAPEILVITLKRFRHDSYFTSKIGTHDLDIKPFMKSKDKKKSKKSIGLGSPLKNGRSKQSTSTSEDIETDEDEFIDRLRQSQSTKYDLFALINHHGGLGGGHYVTYARNPITNCWFEYDDSKVTPKSEADISKVQAYVLFYKRQETDESRLFKEEVFESLENTGYQENGVLISKLWWTRWKWLTSHPGEITNSHFVCPHGAVDIHKHPDAANRVLEIPETIWDQLVRRYGCDTGLNPITELKRCNICEDIQKQLALRRQKESEEINLLDSKYIRPDAPWYLISWPWLLSWHAWKNGGNKIPGPIDNSNFLNADGSPKKKVRVKVDYRGVNEDVWNYFYSIYGGGPVCKRKIIDVYSEPWN